MNRIYLDNAATTRTDPKAIEVMQEIARAELGNASSIHLPGVKAATEVEKARAVIAGAIGAEADEIVFTSGGTESNNLALLGYCRANRKQGNHLIVSAIEHPSVLETARWLSTQGWNLSLLPVDREGFCDPMRLRSLLTGKTALVSVMHANNEVGTIQDIAALGAVCEERGIAFHVDACQSFTKTELNVREAAVCLMTLSAHKIHGPRGIGAIYIRKGTRLEPILHGGGQENGLRSGTYSTELIGGFAAAVGIARSFDAEKMTALRDAAIERILRSIPGTVLNGPTGPKRLCNSISLSFPSVSSPLISSKDLFFELDKRGISTSPSSACASAKKQPSHVLLAMGRDEHQAEESIRISLSKWTTLEEIETLVSSLVAIIHEKGGRTVAASA